MSIPFLGPWCGLTAPLGIWSFIVLRSETIRSQFHTNGPRGCITASDQTDEEALAQAAKMERKGDWEAAISMYRKIGTRWPEHVDYINNCIESIEENRSR